MIKTQSIWANKNPENLQKQLIQHDNAFLNSLLSHSIYTGRKWTLQFIKNSKEIQNYNENLPQLNSTKSSSLMTDLLDKQISNKLFKENFKSYSISELENEYSNKKRYKKLDSKTIYEMYISDFIRNTFDFLNLPNLNSHLYKSKTYGYETQVNFEYGNYEALDNLANAAVFRSLNLNGQGYTLHLVFRGTDNQARSMKDFFLKAYTDMSAYYDAFKPLENAVLEYAKDPKNNISNIHVSGHSLGGTMVQEFFQSEATKNSGLDIKGYTYGAPGNVKKIWHIIGPMVFHALRKGELIEKTKEIGTKFIHKSFTVFKNMIALKFDEIIKNEAKSIVDFVYPYNPNITQYKHSTDLIPIAGWFGYKNTGKTVFLNDNVNGNQQDSAMFEGKLCLASEKREHKFFNKFKLLGKSYQIFIDYPINSFKRTFQLGYHDMLRYVQNVHYHISATVKEDMDLKYLQLTPHFNKFKQYRDKFSKTLSMTNAEIFKETDPDYPCIGMKREIDAIANLRRINLITHDLTGETKNRLHFKKTFS